MARYLTRKRIVGGAVLLAALCGVLLIFRQANYAKDLADPIRARRDGRPIPVRAAVVEEKPSELVIGATALTEPCERAEIRIGLSKLMNASDPVSPVIVKAVHVHDGQYVKKGELLFELDDAVTAQTVKQKQLALDSFKAELDRVRQQNSLNEKTREVDLESNRINLGFRKEDLQIKTDVFEKMTELRHTASASILEYYDAKSKLANARADLAAAEVAFKRAKDAVQVGVIQDEAFLKKATNDYQVAKVDLDTAKIDLDRSKLTSPIDGFVNRVDIVPGVTVGLTNLLTTVVKLDPLFLRLDVPQERIDEVSVGQKAEIVLDSFPKETFEGTVIRVLPYVNYELRVLPVVVELKNPNNRVKPGISGFVRLRSTRNVLAVPAQAVIQHGGEAMVFRVEDGHARLRPVHVGRLVETGVLEVKDGVRPGDEIVIYDNFYRHPGALTSTQCYLQDNDLVNTDWRKWARRN